VSRAVVAKQAVCWVQFARDVALEIVRNAEADAISKVRADAIILRLDIALDRLHEALDIKPSDAAVAEIVAAQEKAA
jgi:hypothetical protein